MQEHIQKFHGESLPLSPCSLGILREDPWLQTPGKGSSGSPDLRIREIEYNLVIVFSFKESIFGLMKFEHVILWKFFVVNMVYFVVSFYLSQEKGFTLDIQFYATYSSVLNRSHVAAIWNFDPNYSLSN